MSIARITRLHLTHGFCSRLPSLFRYHSTAVPCASSTPGPSSFPHSRRGVLRSAASLSSSPDRGIAGDRGLVPPTIWARTSAKLHLRKGHPLCTLREAIEGYFHAAAPGVFEVPPPCGPVVSAAQCFDNLLVPEGHPSRAESDTYYLDAGRTRLLRAHMTAHDVDILKSGVKAFVHAGDVYRRDTVDRTHYPVFHQLDGVRLFEGGDGDVTSEEVVRDLKTTLEGLARELFGRSTETRWVDAEFPFTNPSMELEVWWRGEWLEVLGCGQLHPGVLERAGVYNEGRTKGWAFGLGLERLAMVLFEIPDIRLFWSEDQRFLTQFAKGTMDTKFRPFSSYPAVSKDVSFWVDDQRSFHENDVHELARDVSGDLIESVECVDRFEKNGRLSHCYRVTFRSMERSLTHEEVNRLFGEMRTRVEAMPSVTLR